MATICSPKSKATKNENFKYYLEFDDCTADIMRRKIRKKYYRGN